MAKFTTRVELHDADDDDYENLHVAMERQGFSRTIKSDDGVIYQLPPAEYDFEGSIKRGEVLDKAKSAAKTTGRKYAVLVTESDGRTWHNLDRA